MQNTDIMQPIQLLSLWLPLLSLTNQIITGLFEDCWLQSTENLYWIHLANVLSEPLTDSHGTRQDWLLLQNAVRACSHKAKCVEDECK